MSKTRPFCLAVVQGKSTGKQLVASRHTVSMGSDPGNELVLEDPDVNPWHCVIELSDGKWRISASGSVVVDRRWTHPNTSERGALVFIGSAAVVAFTGELSSEVVDQEIQKHGGQSAPTPNPAGLVTHIESKTMELDLNPFSEAPTIAMPAPHPGKTPNVAELDILQLSQMPTVAGERAPSDLREAARVRLLDERAPVAPSVLKEKERAPWASQATEANAEAAHVLAVPESQVLQAKSDGSGANTEPARNKSAQQAEIVELASARNHSSAATNAWGEPIEYPIPNTLSPDDEAQEAATEPPRPSARADEKHRKNRAPRSDSSLAPQRALARTSNLDGSARHQIVVRTLARETQDPALTLLRDPDGEFATSIRLLGTRIEEFSRTLGYRSYMVTSAEPLTGKTTSASNLVFALTEDANRRVALVEANFRSPRLAEIFNIPKDTGLIPVLEGKVALADSVVKVADRNLIVLPAGGDHKHPAEVLSAPRFKTLIAELANTVDIAIIDAPATTPFADTNLILPLVDAVLVVVSNGCTLGKWVTQATSQLGENRILGALYNHIPQKLGRTLGDLRKDRMRQP